MGGRLLFDPEGGPPEILEHLDDPALLLGRRQAQSGARRDDHIFLASHEHGSAVGAGGDDVARLERGPADRGSASPATLDLHGAGRFGHPPERDRGESGLARQEQEDEECAQEHSVTFRSGPRARAPAPSGESLQAAEGA
jgi:hypothetical protein